MTQQPHTPSTPTTPLTDVDEADLAARSHGNPAVVSDPGSELVDPDPAHDTPASPSPVTHPQAAPAGPAGVSLVYAGANAGGQALNVCSGLNGCGALVQDEFKGKHLDWHAKGLA